MRYTFQKLTQVHAIEIADTWKYGGEYGFYDMTEDPEDYSEFTSELLRAENDYFEALEDGELVGFFCLFPAGRDVEIGLGMHPDLCGMGRGKDFLLQILEFVEECYSFESCVMSVAEFNRRAIKVYQACGFEVCGVSRRETNGGVYTFLTMKKKREISEKTIDKSMSLW